MKRLAPSAQSAPRKLHLNKETVKALNVRDLRRVAGGSFTNSAASDCLEVICPPFDPGRHHLG